MKCEPGARHQYFLLKILRWFQNANSLGTPGPGCRVDHSQWASDSQNVAVSRGGRAAAPASPGNLLEAEILRPHPDRPNQKLKGLGRSVCVLTSPLEKSEAHSSWRTWASGNKTAPNIRRSWREEKCKQVTSWLLWSTASSLWKGEVRNNNTDLKEWLWDSMAGVYVKAPGTEWAPKILSVLLFFMSHPPSQLPILSTSELCTKVHTFRIKHIRINTFRISPHIQDKTHLTICRVPHGFTRPHKCQNSSWALPELGVLLQLFFLL